MTSRRTFTGAALLLPTALLSRPALAQAITPTRQFAPLAADAWRTFELTTRIDLVAQQGATRLWVPLPSLQTDWQQSVKHSLETNARTRLTQVQGLGSKSPRMIAVQFDKNQVESFAEVKVLVKTKNRQSALRLTNTPALRAREVAAWTAATNFKPTDGIVGETARMATKGAVSDMEKVQAIYDWVIANAYREPKTKGCGVGNIKAMLESGNMGGKCADINALFVGLCRAVGVPARDVYGIRLAPSAFGYKELGAASAKLTGAQHCRAEVFLAGLGWVAMDPADVTKVMRQETSEWLKITKHEVVAPINRALFGGWEGNWMGYNMGSDIALPQSKEGKLPFFMYPQAEDARGRFDPYDADGFKYQISAREMV